MLGMPACFASSSARSTADREGSAASAVPVNANASWLPKSTASTSATVMRKSAALLR